MHGITLKVDCGDIKTYPLMRVAFRIHRRDSALHVANRAELLFGI